MTWIAGFLGTVFVLLALLHFYWGFGGAWASTIVLPKREDGSLLFRPGAVASSAVGLLLLAAAYVALASQDWVPGLLSEGKLSAALGLMSAAFFLRALGDFRYCGFVKRIRSTDFARMDTRLYSPMFVLLGVFSLALCLS